MLGIRRFSADWVACPNSHKGSNARCNFASKIDSHGASKMVLRVRDRW